MKKYGLIFLAIFSLLMVACNKDKKAKSDFPFAGLELGMTVAEADSVMAANNMKASGAGENESTYEGNINAMDWNWNLVVLKFKNDTLASIEFQDWNNGDAFASVLKRVENRLNLDINADRIKKFGNPFEWGVIRGNDGCLITIDNVGGGIDVNILPRTSETEVYTISRFTSLEIDKQLEELANAMANYAKATNSIVRQSYEEDVIRSTRYLQNNYDKMNDRQKEIFNKLRNI